MAAFKPRTAFTAQYRNVTALHRLFTKLDSAFEPPNLEPAEILPMVVFMAFSIESYVNSIGARKLEIWDEVERLPWKKKLAILHKVAGAKPEWNREPLQFAQEIFTLRDKLAHGKAEVHVAPAFSSPEEAEDFALNDEFVPPWFYNITTAWIQEARERFTQLMEYLGTMHALDPGDYRQAFRVDVLRSPHTDA